MAVHHQWAAIYGAAAEDSGAVILPCCGYDYAVADFAFLEAVRLFPPSATLTHVTGYTRVLPGPAGLVLREESLRSLIDRLGSPAASLEPGARPCLLLLSCVASRGLPGVNLTGRQTPAAVPVLQPRRPRWLAGRLPAAAGGPWSGARMWAHGPSPAPPPRQTPSISRRRCCAGQAALGQHSTAPVWRCPRCPRRAPPPAARRCCRWRGAGGGGASCRQARRWGCRGGQS